MPKANVKKCVTIISSNIGRGGALACVSLGRALEPHYDVQLLGSCFGSEPWLGLADVNFEVDILPGAGFPKYARIFAAARRQIRGDVVIAHQYRLPSFGLALVRRTLNGTPFAAYIDDDDLALTLGGRNKRLRDRIRAPNGDLYTRLVYRLRNKADAVFCGSDYFSERLGGITVPLGRDARLYQPDSNVRHQVRQELGLADDSIVVGFMGNPRPHVGIRDLVQALEIVNDDRLVLVVVPPGQLSQYGSELFAQHQVNIRVLENQPSARVPDFLSASDIVVVPQRCDDVSLGQLPARLVEAMAMAKPIIATRVGGIPKTLRDCGLYVDDRAPEDIASKLRWVLSNPAEASTMGQRARDIFIEDLSLEAMAARLVPVIDSICRKREPTK